MRILLLTQVIPYPPDSGPKVKTYHVLRYLAERGHSVTLVSYLRDGDGVSIEGLRPYCSAIHPVPLRRSRIYDLFSYLRSWRTGLPFLVTRDEIRQMKETVSGLVRDERFDIIQADQLTMGQFALLSNQSRRVLDAHNAVWTIVDRSARGARPPLRPILAEEARRLKFYEGELCRQMDAVLAVSQVDRNALVEAGAPQDHINVIPISISCSALRPVQGAAASREILIVSTLFYPPNADGVRWFLREVFPRVQEQVRSARLTIVGPRPPRDILQYATREPAQIDVTGYVPDLAPHFERAALMVVPVRAGSGMRVRILESLARGMPVVTTTLGAEGIDIVPGEHLLIADEPQEFAEATIRLLQDPALRCALARNGRHLIETKYDRNVVLPRLQSVYESLVRN